ncbi:MAG: hypothetical protein ABF289_12985 [Clostridiales bacterium]
MLMKSRISSFLVLIMIVLLCSCEKEQFDEYTGKWESNYSIYEISKKNDEYIYIISDKNGKNSVTYNSGKYNEKTYSVIFENKDWKDEFKFNKETKKIILLDSRKEGDFEYILSKVKENNKEDK